jgi:hypothetical protein
MLFCAQENLQWLKLKVTAYDPSYVGNYLPVDTASRHRTLNVSSTAVFKIYAHVHVQFSRSFSVHSGALLI